MRQRYNKSSVAYETGILQVKHKYYKSSVTYDAGVFQELGESWDRDISRAL